MEDLVESLSRLLQPPSQPAGATGDWGAVERSLGVALPADYKAFVALYGYGWISEFLLVHTPFALQPGERLEARVASVLDNLRGYQAERIVKEPHPLFPEPGGLLPFGTTENTNYLSWRTAGPPEAWDVVVWDTDFLTFRHLKGSSFGRFLLDVLEGRSALFEHTFPRDIPENRTFSPKTDGGG